jgi:preprotein translocase subunit SecE
MIGKTKKFISEVKVEMSKVTWSTRQELIHSTLIVLGAMAFLAIFVGIADLFFSQVINLLLR